MTVTEIHFQRVVPTRPYGNYTFGATATLEPGENESLAMLRLTAMVDNACSKVPAEPETVEE